MFVIKKLLWIPVIASISLVKPIVAGADETNNQIIDSQIRYEDIDNPDTVNDLAKDRSNVGSWYRFKSGNKEIFYNINENQEVEEYDKTPNQKFADSLENKTKGKLKIEIENPEQGYTYLVNLKNKDGEIYSINVENNKEEELVADDYEINNINSIDPDGCMKEAEYEASENRLKIEEGKENNVIFKITNIKEIEQRPIEELLKDENKEEQIEPVEEGSSEEEESQTKEKKPNESYKILTTAAAIVLVSLGAYAVYRMLNKKGDYIE